MLLCNSICVIGGVDLRAEIRDDNGVHSIEVPKQCIRRRMGREETKRMGRNQKSDWRGILSKIRAARRNICGVSFAEGIDENKVVIGKELSPATLPAVEDFG